LDPCELYRRHQRDISEIAEQVSRAQGLYGEESEDFLQDCHVHFLNNDCLVLRRYRGESSILTYIRAVVENRLLGYRERLFGKWRPSATARVLGAAATMLERLLLRDGLPFEAVCEIMLERGLAKTRVELEELVGRLPLRARRQRPQTLDDPDRPVDPVARERPDSDFERREHQRETTWIWECLRQAIASMPPSDRLSLTLRFRDGLTISAVADLQNIDRKVFFRRFRRLLKTVREALLSAGVAETLVRELLRDELSSGPEDDWERAQ